MNVIAGSTRNPWIPGRARDDKPRKGTSYGPREQGRYAQEFFTTVKTAYTLA